MVNTYGTDDNLDNITGNSSFQNGHEFRRVRLFAEGEGYGIFDYKVQMDFAEFNDPVAKDVPREPQEEEERDQQHPGDGNAHHQQTARQGAGAVGVRGGAHARGSKLETVKVTSSSLESSRRVRMRRLFTDRTCSAASIWCR